MKAKLAMNHQLSEKRGEERGGEGRQTEEAGGEHRSPESRGDARGTRRGRIQVGGGSVGVSELVLPRRLSTERQQTG